MLSPEKPLAEEKLKAEGYTVSSRYQGMDDVFTLRSMKG